jgi:hypothetical protein
MTDHPLGPLFDSTDDEEDMDKLYADWRRTRLEFPATMPAIVDLAKQAMAKGYERWSMDAIFHILRWQTGLDTESHGLKFNNNHTAPAARDVMAEHPEFEGFFQKRERKPRGNFGQIH